MTHGLAIVALAADPDIRRDRLRGELAAAYGGRASPQRHAPIAAGGCGAGNPAHGAYRTRRLHGAAHRLGRADALAGVSGEAAPRPGSAADSVCWRRDEHGQAAGAVV